MAGTRLRRQPRVRAASLLLLALLCLWASPAWAAGLRFELVEVQMPETLPRGQHIRVPVLVRNLSEEPWDPAKRDHLAYHLTVAGESKPLVFDGLRTELPGVVQPGESVYLDAHLEVPDHEGPLMVEWAMVREGVQWLPRPSGGAGPIFERPVGEPTPVWSLLSVDLPAWATVGVPIELEAELVNEGWVTWNPERGDAIALHWYDQNGGNVQFEGARVAPEGRVPPGARTRVRWTTLVPGDPGLRTLRVEPVREGVQWYGAPRSSPPPARVQLESSPYAWAVEGEFRAPTISAGDELTIPVTLVNRGEVPWGTRDVLSYQWIDAKGEVVGEGPRTYLPNTVAPGSRVQVQARLAAPNEPGSHRLRWGMLREGVRWYDPPEGEGGAPIWELVVSAPRLAFELVEASAPRLSLTGDLRWVDVVIRNTGSDPWDPERGDALAYHWLDADGEMLVFEGRRSALPGPIAPGERVELQARVELPHEHGRHELAFEMVREQVRWYGNAASAGHTRALRAIPVFHLGVGLGFCLLAFAARLARARWPRTEPLMEWLWLIWLGISLGILLETFAELSRLEFWKGGMALAWSSCAWLVLPLCVLGGVWRRGAGLLLLLFCGALTLADVVYMHFFGSIIPVSSLGHANHLGEVLGSARTRLVWEQAWLFFPLVVGAVAWRISPVAESADEQESPRRRVWPHRLVSALLCLALGYPAADRLNDAMQGSLGARVFSEQRNAQRFGIFNAHAFDVLRAVREAAGRGALDAESEAKVVAFFEDASARAAARTAAHPQLKGRARGKNLLLIQVEALQSWVIGTEVDGQEITPYLNRLRSEGLSFTGVVDQTAQGKTSDAEYLVLNSQHPLPRGATSFLRADNHFWSLAHALGEVGYTSSSAHPYRRGFWNRAVLHPRYGFTSSVFKRELGEGQLVGWGLADGLFFERMLPRLRAAKQPWFAFWVTLSLHHPYDEFPANLEGLELGELEGTRLGNYLQGMNYFDRSLETLVQGLEEGGLLDETVIALYGDHDARFELDEHPELLELAGAGVWTPSTFAVMEKVPFFVLSPGLELRGEIDTLGGQIDVGPTLLHLLGVDRPASFVGHPLFEGLSPEFSAYPNGSAYGPDRVYVKNGRDIPRGGSCFFYPSGKARPRGDCDEVAARARKELRASRAVADADLQRSLAGVPGGP